MCLPRIASRPHKLLVFFVAASARPDSMNLDRARPLELADACIMVAGGGVLCGGGGIFTARTIGCGGCAAVVTPQCRAEPSSGQDVHLKGV